MPKQDDTELLVLVSHEKIRQSDKPRRHYTIVQKRTYLLGFGKLNAVVELAVVYLFVAVRSVGFINGAIGGGRFGGAGR